MSDAPERIWARHVAHYGLDDLELGCWWHTPEYGDEVEYVRADRIEELEAKLAEMEAERERKTAKQARALDAAIATLAALREEDRG